MLRPSFFQNKFNLGTYRAKRIGQFSFFILIITIIRPFCELQIVASRGFRRSSTLS